MKCTVRKTLTLLLILALLLTGGAAPTAFASGLPFTDVSESSEHYEAIKYVYENGIMNGTSTTIFEPGGLLTRGQIVTMLYRLSGETVQIAPDFTDVAPGRFYYYPIGWAQKHKIVNGLTDTEFGPDQNVTREQLITFLHRYLTLYKRIEPEVPASNVCNNWSDVSSLSNFSRDSVTWAANCGILTGKANYTFSPQIAASRGYCAEYFHAFMELAFGNAKVFTMTDAVSSIDCNDMLISYINNSGIADYDCNQWIDAEGPHVEYGFYNSNLVFVDCHGEADYLVWENCLPMRIFHKSAIDDNKMQSVELAYISACNAGQGFCYELRETGKAKNVVGFTTVIEYVKGNDDTGAMLFNRLFFASYMQGNTLYDASMDALSGLYAVDKAYSGCDYIVIYPDPFEV